MDTNPCKEVNIGSDGLTVESAGITWIYNLLSVLNSVSHTAQGTHTFQATYEVGKERKIVNLESVKIFYNGKSIPFKDLGSLSTNPEDNIPSNLIEECDLRDLYNDLTKDELLSK